MSEYLPAEPGVYGPSDELGFRQRWQEGAFGDDVTSLEGVDGYRVRADEWTIGEDGVPERTITEAEVVEP